MKKSSLFNSICRIMLVIFCWTSVVPPAFAQTPALPLPGTLLKISPPAFPVILRGIKVNVNDPLRMEFLVDKGDAELMPEEFEAQAQRLLGYFLASLTIPEKDVWVNLSPYEGDRIVQDDLGRTAMGRDLLAQDYLLKQLASSLTHPDEATGKSFWGEVYRRAYEKFGTTDVPGLEGVNKVWIVPQKAVVYEARSPDGAQISAYVDATHLKVMLEADYLARQKEAAPAADAQDAADLSRAVMREVVIPVIERDVNEGDNFARLRQIYHSLVLSFWLKKKLRQSARQADGKGTSSMDVFGRSFVDRLKTAGNEIDDPAGEKDRIYGQYVEAFKTGAYNFIKEEVDLYSQELIPRKYFSGGFDASQMSKTVEIKDGYKITTTLNRQGEVVSVVAELLTDADIKKLEKAKQRAVKKSQRAVGKGVRRAALGFAVVAAVSLSAYLIYEQFANEREAARAEKARIEKEIERVKSMTLAGESVVNTMSVVGENVPPFEYARSNKEGGPVELASVNLSSMTGEPYSPELAARVGKTFQQYAYDFCPQIMSKYSSVNRFFGLIAAIMKIESNYQQTRVQGDATVWAPGFGVLQIEANTLVDLLKSDKFQNFINDTTPYRILDGIDLKPDLRKLYDQRNQLRYNDENAYDVQAVKKSPLQHWYVQAAVVLWFWEDMFTRDFYSLDDSYLVATQHVFKRYQITLPDSLSTRIKTPRPAPLTYIEDILEKYPELSMDDVVDLILGSNHKGGGPSVKEKYFRYVDVMGMNESQRREYLRKATDLREQASARISEIHERIKNFLFLIKKGEKVQFDDVQKLRFHQGDASLLGQILKRLSAASNDEELREFKVLVMEDMSLYRLVKQRQLAEIGATEKYNRLLKILKEGLDKKDHGQLSEEALQQKNDRLGGIDLTDQAQGLDVQGDAGVFGLNRSPEKMGMLDREVTGFSPRIVGVQSVGDVRAFLGFTAAK